MYGVEQENLDEYEYGCRKTSKYARKWTYKGVDGRIIVK